ncbi:MAG: putative hydrolase of the superfamily [Acidobacteriaceae bacterium]|jgi:putative hydrolase of the HAD superfamily|nr:putative hydrolase of the superfamily [Acidobacteriaceae bacterium]
MASAPPEIRAIYWDIGGVLLTNGWDHEERARVLQQFAIPREEYEARHADANDRWERGELSDDEFLKQTIFFKERSFTPAEFIRAVREQSKWLPGGARNVVTAAREHSGLKMAMLNNESGPLNDYRIETFGLTEYFDGFFSSAYIGMRKPEPRMFRAGAAMLHFRPEECAFIDDREKNCAAAAEVGMHAIQYKGEEPLRNALGALGVRLG